MKKVDVVIGGVSLCLEAAVDDESRRIGLMHRKSLGPNEGMIFDFGKPVTSGFWMKDTVVPLDIAFIDESENIFSIAKLTPLDETLVRPGNPYGNEAYRWAVEMPSGWFDDHIKGTQCEIASAMEPYFR